MRKILPFLLILALSPLAACKQELPRTLEQPNVFGTVQEVKQVADEKQLIYVQGADPQTKNWGSAGAYYVKVDDQWHKLHWEQAEKFNALKVGDKVNLHPTEYISCVGESDLKPTCNRLMRVYKNERRINPLQTR